MKKENNKNKQTKKKRVKEQPQNSYLNGVDTDGTIPHIYPGIAGDLAADNLENDYDTTAADSQDL